MKSAGIWRATRGKWLVGAEVSCGQNCLILRLRQTHTLQHHGQAIAHLLLRLADFLLDGPRAPPLF